MMKIKTLVIGRALGTRGRADTKEDENSKAAGDKKMEGVTATASPDIPMHPAIAPISYLLGTWKGQGEGGFPTINSFSYVEQLNFSHSGKVHTPGPPTFSFQKLSQRVDSVSE